MNGSANYAIAGRMCQTEKRDVLINNVVQMNDNWI